MFRHHILCTPNHLLHVHMANRFPGLLDVYTPGRRKFHDVQAGTYMTSQQPWTLRPWENAWLKELLSSPIIPLST